ncbi:MAG: hypothetical protein RIT81_05515 [Deltaproteobacteria bacterium]
MNHSTHVAPWGLVLATFALCGGCGDDFSPYNEVDGFRLLAIRATPPELRPGEDVELTALVVGDDAPRFTWRWCAVTRGPGERHTCAIQDGEIESELPNALLSTSTSATFAWPADPRVTDALCDLAAQREAPNGAPRLDCASERPELYVRLEVESAAGERVIALHALPLVLDDVPRNTNPAPDDVHVEVAGAMKPIEGARLEGEVQLELRVPEAAAETYGGDREILRATWFVTGGETDAMRTAFIPGDAAATFAELTRNVWILPTAPREVTLYLVLRDDRGGVSWLVRRAVVEVGAS